MEVADLDVGLDDLLSPSSSATIRMMPCIAGCAGPRLTKRFSVPLSGTPSPRKISWTRRVPAAGGVALVVSGVGVMGVPGAQFLGPISGWRRLTG